MDGLADPGPGWARSCFGGTLHLGPRVLPGSSVETTRVTSGHFECSLGAMWRWEHAWICGKSPRHWFWQSCSVLLKLQDNDLTFAIIPHESQLRKLLPRARLSSPSTACCTKTKLLLPRKILMKFRDSSASPCSLKLYVKPQTPHQFP